MLLALTNTDELDRKIETTQSKYDDIQKSVEFYINENAHSKLDQKEYKAKYSDYLKTYENEKSKLENLQNLKSERKTKSQKVKDFINQIKEIGEIITEFNDELFFTTIDKIMVNADKTAVFTFKNGVEIILNTKESA
jgi:site-specific DNA recombinase